MQGQVGGLSKNKRPMMSVAPNYVLKHVRSDHRGVREVAFYEAVMKNTSFNQRGDEASSYRPLKVLDSLALRFAISLQDPVIVSSEQSLIKSLQSSKRETNLLQRLVNFTPAYYGVVHLSWDTDYIVLQDVTANFAKPCVIDIKMGTQTYEPDASTEKRNLERNKYVHQTTFGMRIVSMRLFDPEHADADERGYRSFPKSFGRELNSREAVLTALKTFFSCGVTDSSSNNVTPKLRARVISSIVAQLRQLHDWFECNDRLAFYASSLLLVYDGDSCRGDATSAKMIDFGHVRRQRGGDHGYAFGLRTLISMLTALINDAHATAE